MNKKLKGVITAVVLTILAILFFLLFDTGSSVKKNVQTLDSSENGIKVYTLSGKSEDIELNNGVIVLTKDKHIVDGGQIDFIGEPVDNIKTYFEKLYTYKDGEKEVILSNSVGIEGDMEGMSLGYEKNLNRHVGSISSKTLFYNDDFENVKEELYYSLSGIKLNGDDFEYIVKLELIEVY